MVRDSSSRQCGDSTMVNFHLFGTVYIFLHTFFGGTNASFQMTNDAPLLERVLSGSPQRDERRVPHTDPYYLLNISTFGKSPINMR